ncbi:hypothetical protein Tco_1506658 [Tanacetum coccineum]
MDNDLFTYEVKVANIPCNSNMDNDSKHEGDDDMGYDPSDVAFIEWLGSKIFNYKTMDHYTMKALWIYWIRGDDEVELTAEESSDDKDEIAEVIRIDTNIVNYETPLCSAFNEFNYLLKEYGKRQHQSNIRASLSIIRLDVQNGQPVVGERMVIVMEEIFPVLTILETRSITKTLNDDGNIYTNYDDAYEINHEDNEREELCEVHGLPVGNIRKYMMIKYSFNNDEEYVVVKEDEYDDLTITRKEACQVEQ